MGACGFRRRSQSNTRLCLCSIEIPPPTHSVSVWEGGQQDDEKVWLMRLKGKVRQCSSGKCIKEELQKVAT